MDFDFSEEQYALRDLARELFEKESPPSRLRELYEGGERGATCWQSMAKAGLTGLTVPDEYGGAGGNEIDLALVLEEAGRTALPEPLIETVAIAAPLIAEAGTTEQKDDWLPRIASGEATIAVQFADEPFVVGAHEADLMIVLDEAGSSVLSRGAFVVHPVQTEDRARPMTKLESADLEKGARLGTGEDTRRAAMRAALAAAGTLNGVAMRLLEMTLAHVKTRNQFGRPVGSFQAVKHRLADVHIAIESARSATWYAAYAFAHGLEDARPAVSVAKVEATDAEALANEAALQLHGGIGFTWEHDLHLWLKRGKALEQAYGSAAAHRRIISDTLFEAGPTDG